MPRFARCLASIPNPDHRPYRTTTTTEHPFPSSPDRVSPSGRQAGGRAAALCFYHKEVAVEDGLRTRDLVLMSMSDEQLDDRSGHIFGAIRLARHTHSDANVINILMDQYEAVEHEKQCRIDEGNVPF